MALGNITRALLDQTKDQSSSTMFYHAPMFTSHMIAGKTRRNRTKSVANGTCPRLWAEFRKSGKADQKRHMISVHFSRVSALLLTLPPFPHLRVQADCRWQVDKPKLIPLWGLCWKVVKQNNLWLQKSEVNTICKISCCDLSALAIAVLELSEKKLEELNWTEVL